MAFLPSTSSAKTASEWLAHCTVEAEKNGESDQIISIGPPISQRPIADNPDGFIDRIDSIESVTPNAQSIPRYLSMKGDWRAIHESTGSGEGIKVGVCDTGASRFQIQAGELSNVVDGRDFTGSRNGWYDVHGHGTHVACAIGAQDDKQGIIGVAPNCELLIAKVLGDQGSGSSSSIAAGVRWLADAGCDVINMSLGGGGVSQTIESAVVYARSKGVIVVASLGNSGNQGAGHPGTSLNTIGSAAIDYNWQTANFSSRYGGQEKPILADFGVQTLSCGLCGRSGCTWVRMSGTSMSAPVTSGTLALVKSWHKKRGHSYADLNEFYASLRPAVKQLQSYRETGHGWLDVEKLIAMTPPEPPDCCKPEPDPEPENPKPSGTYQVIVTDRKAYILKEGPRFEQISKAALMELVD